MRGTKRPITKNNPSRSHPRAVFTYAFPETSDLVPLMRYICFYNPVKPYHSQILFSRLVIKPVGGIFILFYFAQHNAQVLLAEAIVNEQFKVSIQLLLHTGHVFVFDIILQTTNDVLTDIVRLLFLRNQFELLFIYLYAVIICFARNFRLQKYDHSSIVRLSN